MTVRKLYGTMGSPATMRAMASIFEHDLEFEFIPIDLKTGEHKLESFLSLNPFGQVPVYQEDDLTLFESRTIMRYISHFYYTPDNEQVYESPRLQGIAAGWIDVEDHHFDPPASKLVFELIFKPKFFKQEGNEAIVGEEITKLGKVLDVYECRLSESKYLGGDKFTSADLTHFPYLYYLMGTDLKRLIDDRPCVSAWCRGVLARPASVKVAEMVEQAAK